MGFPGWSLGDGGGAEGLGWCPSKEPAVSASASCWRGMLPQAFHPEVCSAVL